MVNKLGCLSTDQRDLYDELTKRVVGTGGLAPKVIRLILEMLMTPEQAKVLVAIPYRQLGVPGVLAEKLGMSEQVIRGILEEMFEKGVCLKSSSKDGYYFAGNTTQLREIAPLKKWSDVLGPEYRDLWQLYAKEVQLAGDQPYFKYQEIPFSRIMPFWRAIKDHPDLDPQEDMRVAYKGARVLAVTPCNCRLTYYDCDCQAPAEVCTLFDGTAELQVSRGNARLITPDEAMEITDMVTFDYPFFHQATREHFKDFHTICHCGMDHCVTVKWVASNNDPTLIDWRSRLYRARYLAVVDADKCVGCQTCYDTITGCVFGAIEMKKYVPMTKLKAWADPERCMGCGRCVVKCPKKAIKMELARKELLLAPGRVEVLGGPRLQTEEWIRSFKEGKRKPLRI